MKALVRHKFGGPDVVRVEEVERPRARGRPRPRPRARELDQQGRLPRARRHAAPRAPAQPQRAAASEDAALRLGHRRRRRGRREGRDRPRVGRRGLRRRPGRATPSTSPRSSSCKKPANVSFEEAATIGHRRPDRATGAARQGRAQAGRARPHQRRARAASGRWRSRSPRRSAATSPPSSARATSSRRPGSAPTASIDRTQENFTRGGERYDLVLDVAGGHSWRALRRALSPGGRVVLVGAHAHRAMLRHLAAICRSRRASGEAASSSSSSRSGTTTTSGRSRRCSSAGS